jgi:phage tail sheath gpL-like
MGGATPGATAPDVSEIIAALPEDQFNVIVNQFTDAANMALLETELDDRWGPIRQNDGRAFSAKLDTLSNLSTYGNARNSQHTSVMGPAKSAPNSAFEWAAAYGAQAAKNLQIDPARPLQTLELVGILPPAPSERFILSERNILLTDGIATAKISDTEARIERAITTFQTNAAGAPDTSYLDVNTPATLSFLRYDFRLTLLTKFPRHKLASDGVRVAPGQAILTPSAAKAEAIAKFRQWQDDLGLVEGFDQFKRDLIVERNASDPNRLDFLMPPDLVNQLRVMGVQFQFLL